MSLPVFSIVLIALVGLASTEYYHIVPTNATALCQHYPNGTCFTLDQLSTHIINTENRNITISFLGGEHLLTWNMTFNRSFEITLSSDKDFNNSAISCDLNTRIEVVDTHIFTVEGLTIYECKGYSQQMLETHLVGNVFFKESQFFDNRAIINEGKSVMHLVNTTTRIQNSIFINNTVLKLDGGVISAIKGQLIITDTKFINNQGAGGGAILLDNVVAKIKNNLFANNSASKHGAAIQAANSNVSICSCTFIHNRAGVDGGALYIYSGGAILINSSIFEHNEATQSGGAFSIESRGSSVTIIDSEFRNNNAELGGALFSVTTMYIERCVFTNNGAKNGGAIITHSSLYSNDTVYDSNTAASHGGAISCFLYSIDSEVTFYGTTMLINNTAGYNGGAIESYATSIIFESNENVLISQNKAYYGGAFYLKESNLRIQNSQTIEIVDNLAKYVGGGIYALNSLIEIENFNKRFVCTKAYITNNRAMNGSGMYLTASTFRQMNSNITIQNNTAILFGGGMFLEKGSTVTLYSEDFGALYILTFIDNSALRGGGVYVSGSANGLDCEGIDPSLNISLNSKQCFFQTIKVRNFSQYLLSMLFINNTAIETGSDIYGGLLDRCTISQLAQILTVHPEYKYRNGISYLQATAGFNWAVRKYIINDSCHGCLTYGVTTNSMEFHNHISSDPLQLCFCENDVLNCNHTHPTVFKKKGEPFILNIVAVDQVGKPVPATIISSLQSEKGGIGRLKEGQQFIHVRDQCTELQYNAYSNDSSAMLVLYADGPCGNQGISVQQVNITFKPCTCPIGLERYPPLIDCVCGCDETLKHNGIISNCSPDNGTIQIDSNTWIQYINSTNSTPFIVTHDCPFDYCVKKPVNISLANQTEENKQCAFNRTGRLCGECGHGLSLVFGSSRCLQCSNYYLFLIVPFALSGIVLVAFILVLNTTVATGTIHGLIFYTNILAANDSIFLPFDMPNFLTVFISWLNLDLGIESCFCETMNYYEKFLLQLVFPTYVFLLIGTIMVLCDHSQRFSNILGKRNPEATLYTLVLLCYSKLLRIVITGLQVTIISYNDKQLIVWLYDANVLYYTATHIPRFLISIIIAIFGVVYTAVLLFGQLLNQCSNHWLMKWTSHKYYIHFMKAHHAPFSDKHRYWVGLLLLARLLHSFVTAFATESFVILFVSTMSLVMLIHKLVNKPIYSTWSVEFSDTFFLGNLTILAVSTSYVKEIGGNQQNLAIVSISAAFTAFVCIIFYHICMLDVCRVRLSKFRNKVLTTVRRSLHYQPVPIREVDQEEPLNDDELGHYIRPDQLREPALDDLIPVQSGDYMQTVLPQLPQQSKMPPTFTEVSINI